MNPHKRRKIARHEAGHALVARKLAIPIAYVTMVGSADSTACSVITPSVGHAAKDNPDIELRIAALTKDVMVAMGGMAADHVWAARNGAPLPKSNRPGYDIDIAHAKSYLARIVLGGIVSEFTTTVTLTTEQAASARQRWEQLWLETRQLVSDNWDAVERIADALTNQDIVSEAEIDALITGRQRVADLLHG